MVQQPSNRQICEGVLAQIVAGVRRRPRPTARVGHLATQSEAGPPAVIPRGV